MKYIKNFNESISSEDTKEVFEPYIDWNMIYDIKDMSLEYLDEGYDLEIFVFYKHFYIYWLRYNHNEDYKYWYPTSSLYRLFSSDVVSVYDLEPIDENKISYKISIAGGLFTRANMHYRDLMDRIKIAYPNISIHNYF